MTLRTAPKQAIRQDLEPYVNSIRYVSLVPVLGVEYNVLIKKDRLNISLEKLNSAPLLL